MAHLGKQSAVEPREGLTGQVLDVEHNGVFDRAFRDGVEWDPGAIGATLAIGVLLAIERGVGAQCSESTETVWMRLYQIFDRAAIQ